MKPKILSIPIPEDARLITGSRTSSVHRFEAAGHGFYVKVYRYPLPWGPLRGILRNTWLAPSRAAREWRALKRLAEAGLQPDLAVALAERRHLGFLLEARLLTRDFGGEDLRARLGREPLTPDEWEGLARFVRALHLTGLRDPDLRARNLLLRQASGEFAKIDASSSRLRRPGNRWDRGRVADLAGLASDLVACGAPETAVRHLLDRQWVPGPPPGRMAARLSAWPYPGSR